MGRGSLGKERGSHGRTGISRRGEAERQRVSELQPALADLFRRLGGVAAVTGTDEAIAALAELYGSRSAAEILDRFVEPFARSHQQQLHRLYEAYADDSRRPPLLSTPASILILERLSNDRFNLRQSWLPEEPMDSYEDLAAIWGVPSPYAAGR